MAAIIEQPNLLGEALPLPAFALYPQFEEIEDLDSLNLPGEIAGRIESAWRGVLSPFDSDRDAQLIARALLRDKPIRVRAGTLATETYFSKLLPVKDEACLSEMTEDFDVLMIQFKGFSHPLVYSLGPEISARTFRDHPHLRRDLALNLGQRRLDALCVYSAAEHQHLESLSWQEEYLAQTAIFLAKHLIWCRTSVLIDVSDGKQLFSWSAGGSVFAEFAGESATLIRPINSTLRRGTWLGPESIHGVNHLLLPPNGLCWCGTGPRYGDCCRERDQLYTLQYFAQRQQGRRPFDNALRNRIARVPTLAGART